MGHILRTALMPTVMILTGVLTSACRGAEPAWVPQVIARGEVRQQIDARPMVARPYRPLHFYGNTVRRLHYRGRLLPQSHDIRAGWNAFVRRG